MNKNEVLDSLVKSGLLKSYSLVVLDDEGDVVVGKSGSGMRESDELTLTFSSGETLVIGTVCSGCAENTSLYLSCSNKPTPKVDLTYLSRETVVKPRKKDSK